MILIPTVVSSLYTFIMGIIAKGNVRPPDTLLSENVAPEQYS